MTHETMWGFTPDLNEHLPPGTHAGRVVRHVRHTYDLVLVPSGERVAAETSGAFAYRAVTASDWPTVGDWVAFDGDRIVAVLPRRSAITRNGAGDETVEQVIVANVDVVMLVFGLDGGRAFTVGMLQRSLTAAWSSGGRPVVVLNKADAADAAHRAAVEAEVAANAYGVPVHTVSAHTTEGIAALRAECAAGQTVALLGKSGVGKSAIVNALARDGEAVDGGAPAIEGRQRRGDGQGRHTTTHKELYPIPGGALIADVPGLRELQVWADEEDVAATFPDVEALADECRFRDCRHEAEPGCAVRDALETGRLSAERWEQYRALQREVAYLERRRDVRATLEEKAKWRAITRQVRAIKER